MREQLFLLPVYHVHCDGLDVHCLARSLSERVSTGGLPMKSPASAVTRWFSGSVVLGLGIVTTVLLFLFAIQLLGSATNGVAPLFRGVFRTVVVGDSAALGVSWLGAYVVANGSVVAALGLSLFNADVITVAQLFLMITGSRLGSAAVVVFIGALDYFQKERYTMQESVSMGILSFLVTHSIYIPVTILGYLFLPPVQNWLGSLSRRWTINLWVIQFFQPLTETITAAIGPILSFVAALGLLFGSLTLFDYFLEMIDTAVFRERLFTHFRHPWLSFAIGFVVTGLTTSVAFSLGVVVPLYNRGYVQRDALVPYILGANLGTLFDTLVVAAVLESTVGIAVVLEVVVIGTFVTGIALVAHDTYCSFIETLDDTVRHDRRTLVAFAIFLVVFPMMLLVLPLLAS